MVHDNASLLTRRSRKFMLGKHKHMRYNRKTKYRACSFLKIESITKSGSFPPELNEFDDKNKSDNMSNQKSRRIKFNLNEDESFSPSKYKRSVKSLDQRNILVGKNTRDTISRMSQSQQRKATSYWNSISSDRGSMQMKQSISKLNQAHRRKDTPWTYDHLSMAEEVPSLRENKKGISLQVSSPRTKSKYSSNYKRDIPANKENITSPIRENRTSEEGLEITTRRRSDLQKSRKTSRKSRQYTDYNPVGKEYACMSCIRTEKNEDSKKPKSVSEKPSRIEHENLTQEKQNRRSSKKSASANKRRTSSKLGDYEDTQKKSEKSSRRKSSSRSPNSRSLRKSSRKSSHKSSLSSEISTDDELFSDGKSLKFTLLPQTNGKSLLIRRESQRSTKVRPTLLNMFDKDKMDESISLKGRTSKNDGAKNSGQIRETLLDMMSENKSDISDYSKRNTRQLSAKELSLNDDRIKTGSRQSGSSRKSKNIGFVEVEDNSAADFSDSIFDADGYGNQDFRSKKTTFFFRDDMKQSMAYLGQDSVPVEEEFEFDFEPDLHLKIDVPSEGTDEDEKKTNAEKTYDSEFMLRLIQELLYNSTCDKEYLFLDFYLAPLTCENDVLISFRTNSAIRQRVTGNPNGLVDLRDRRVYSIEEKTGVIILLDESVFYDVRGVLCNRIRLCHTYHCQNQKCLILLEQGLPDVMKKTIWRVDSVDIIHPFRIVGPYRNFIKRYRKRLKKPHKYHSLPGMWQYVDTKKVHVGTLMTIRDYQLLLEKQRIDKEYEEFQKNK